MNYMPNFTPPSNNVRLFNTLIISIAAAALLFLAGCSSAPATTAEVAPVSLPVKAVAETSVATFLIILLLYKAQQTWRFARRFLVQLIEFL